MIVVCDTTPLNYLILIDSVDVLRILYKQVVAPSAVLTEMQAEGSPQSVVDWTLNKPDWIIVKPVTQISLINELEEGEAEAIALAEYLKADLILLDDKRARLIAQLRGLRVVGTLGVMVEAARTHLIDFDAALAKLKKTNFRFSPAVIESALEKIRTP